VVDSRSYESCRIVTLSGIGPLNAGTVRRFILPCDDIDPLERGSRTRFVGRRRWRARCRAIVAGVRGAGGLSAPLHARIDLMPHQLEPVLAIINGHGTRVLIADDVGLGKTIQAGLIASELAARGAVERILVMTPAGLREQWANELHERLGLTPAIVDMRETRRRSASLPVALNPWTTWPLAIASIDYVKRPEVLPAVLAARWDVVIVDEAHGATLATDRRTAVGTLCERAAYVVLLTATPHSGDRARFESLCRIGEVSPDEHDRLLVFRRTRRNIALGSGRRVHNIRLRASTMELRMHELLAGFSKCVQRSWLGGARDSEQLALAILHKRALSSANSLQLSLIRQLSHADRCDASEHQLTLPLDDNEGELHRGDEAPLWVPPEVCNSEGGRLILSDLLDSARKASRGETKLRRLAALLGRLAARNERALVFTEYRDTLLHVRRTLESAGFAEAGLALLHGGLTRDERRCALDAFRAGRATVLLTTDAGGEGLNLHQGCRVVINLELPWNPMRLEQRIGRVDRIGQSRRVHVFNLVAEDTGEARILDRLKARVAAARLDIDVPDPLTSRENEEVTAFNEHETAAFYADPALTGAAQSECQRLQRARSLINCGCDTSLPAVESGTYVTFARKPVTRARLSGHILVLVQSIAEDRCGRVVAIELSALTIGVRTFCRNDARLAVGGILRAIADREFTATPATVAPHREFWRKRLQRERTIISRTVPVPALIQPGLFESRFDQDRVQAAHRFDESSRVDQLEARAALERPRTRAALVLLP
jgi:superfamily II DNA or RNA helicase